MHEAHLDTGPLAPPFSGTRPANWSRDILRKPTAKISCSQLTQHSYSRTLISWLPGNKARRWPPAWQPAAWQMLKKMLQVPGKYQRLFAAALLVPWQFRGGRYFLAIALQGRLWGGIVIFISSGWKQLRGHNDVFGRGQVACSVRVACVFQNLLSAL